MTAKHIDVEFAGGVELLFDRAKKLRVDLVPRLGSDEQVYPRTIRDLLTVLRSSHIKQRPELFVQGDNIFAAVMLRQNKATLLEDFHSVGMSRPEILNGAIGRCDQAELAKRPGILVVVNDCDWELMGGPDYELEAGDKIVFISTLHGG